MAYKMGKQTKGNINRHGYNKFLTMEDDVKESIDYGLLEVPKQRMSSSVPILAILFMSYRFENSPFHYSSITYFEWEIIPKSIFCNVFAKLTISSDFTFILLAFLQNSV